MAFAPIRLVPVASLRVRSLYLKVVIPIVGLVLGTMGAVSYLAMRAMGDSVRMVAEQRAQFGLAAVRGSFEDVEHLDMQDRGASLQGVIERLGLNPDIDAVRILSTTGKVLYSSKRAEIGQVMAIHATAASDGHGDGVQVDPSRPNVVHASGRIEHKPRCSQCHSGSRDVWAFADVDVSVSRQSAGMRTWGQMASAAAVVQFAVIGAGIALILGLVVVRPVRRLSASMDQVQHGNLDVMAEPSGTSEVDGLVTGFNDMVARLRRARQVEEDAQRSHLAHVEQLATLGEMAASLAHEIRNPLSGTKAAIDVLASEEKAEEPRRILRHVSEELGRVDGVVRQLLSFARPKAPVIAKVDLRTVLDDAVMLTKPKAAAQGVSLEVDGVPGPLDVLADADMVLQVIVNLLLNALQALEGVQGATIVLSAGAGSRDASCRVRDNGPGVPADRSETIFRPFVTTKPRGTGLGLATSRRLIELQGGRLWLDNPGEPGACFTFTLPVVSAPAKTGA
jgi:signal transduction histidine kinase